MPATIDSHQHFWELGRFDYRWLEAPALARIHRSFLPADLAPHLSKAGIDQSIFVQTQHNVEENRWALELARQNPFIAGVVGWVDLASPQCEDQVREFRADPRFVGVRHITQDEPDDNFIIRDDVRRGLRVLERHRVPFDLLFYVKHLRHAAPLAAEFPNLPLVIDHLAKPKIKAQDTSGWLEALTAAAAWPNVYCKLSGMITEADWSRWKPAHLRPYVQTALDLFGPERLMFGSDWPVCELAGSYQQVLSALEEALGAISPSEHAMIFGGTARKFYGLA